MGSRRQCGPRGLCAYVVDVFESDGCTSVPEGVPLLLKKCIEDKLFSENRDEVVMCRADSTSKVHFETVTWNCLRNALKILTEKREGDDSGGVSNPTTFINRIASAVNKQSKEDSYEEKKIVFFADLRSYILSEEDIANLADKLLQYNIFISIILPPDSVASDLQVQNSKLLDEVFNREEYENTATVMSFQKAKCQILNTQSKKISRPTPWNCPLEISPRISINVGGYVCTRKNKVGEMSRVLLKQTESEVRQSTAVALTSSHQAGSSSLALKPSHQTPSSSSLVVARNGNTADISESETDKREKTVVVEMAKSVLEKEQIWTDNDGNSISEEDIGKAYYFGDKLIPFNELESEDSYKSGEKCLKVLVFCPIENINPAFHSGDGITLFYPKKDDKRAEAMFNALLKAMINSNKVAIVRKVYLKDKKVTIGTLAPDEERWCLVFSELCFADDISIPQFPLLIRKDDIENEESVETNKKEDLIDKLIASKTIESFCPSDGPADPAVSALRDKISGKILKECAKALEFDKQETERDTIQVFFEELMLAGNDELAQIRSTFPLTENKVDNERLAGKNIFRKRQIEGPSDSSEEKKPKVEIPDTKIEVEQAENADEIDDLLDEL